jgi:hypothetical protein
MYVSISMTPRLSLVSIQRSGRTVVHFCTYIKFNAPYGRLKVSVVLWSHNVKAHLNDDSSTMKSKEMPPLEYKQFQVSQSPFPKTEINVALQ